jgi:hypothetical protein
MALETLKGIEAIGGFEVMQQRPENEEGMVNWKLFDEMRKTKPIYVDHDVNMISFRIQNGPIKEVGLNGCDVSTIIEAASLIVEGLNKQFPCDENHKAIRSLNNALDWLEERKINREKRQVEGRSIV